MLRDVDGAHLRFFAFVCALFLLFCTAEQCENYGVGLAASGRQTDYQKICKKIAQLASSGPAASAFRASMLPACLPEPNTQANCFLSVLR
jgi:hypothetical protein